MAPRTRSPIRPVWAATGALALMSWALCAASPTRAQDTPQHIYIISVPMDPGVEAEAARVGAAARATLRGVAGVEWGESDRRFLGYEQATLERLARARQRLEEGRQAYLNLELDQAIEGLSSAVNDFDAAASALEDPSDLGETLLFLGASQVFANRTRDARSTFARLHIQMPHITPDPETFNPDIVTRYQQATPRDAANPGGSITVESDPPGAIAYVDFVPRGRTPITVDTLIEGQHIVRVTRPGAMPFVQQVEISRRSPMVNVNAMLQDNDDTAGMADAFAALPTAGVAELGQATPLAELATLLEVDKLGIIRVSPGDSNAEVRLEFLVFDVHTGRRILRGEGPSPTAPGQLESNVGRVVQNGLQAAMAPTQQGDNEQIIGGGGEIFDGTGQDTGGGDSVITKWWFWTAIGGAAVILALTIGLLVARDDGPQLGRDQGGVVVFEF